MYIMLRLTLTPSNTPLFFLSSKKQYDETSFNLKLVSFQEEQNFLCDAGKSCLHGKGPNGDSDDTFPEESCHLRLSLCRRESEQLQYSKYKMCVCMCVVT